MAYAQTGRVAEIRKELRALFPTVKFTVNKHHWSGVNIHIMKSSFDWSNPSKSVNEYYLDKEENAEFLKQVYAIASKGVTFRETGDYGRQPSMYINIEVGKWDKPHEKI